MQNIETCNDEFFFINTNTKKRKQEVKTKSKPTKMSKKIFTMKIT